MTVALTDSQSDALTELISIGFGRAAASLSRLTGSRVDLDVPEVAIHPIAELHHALGRFLRGEIASVHQVFSGPVAGDALLILDAPAAGAVKELLTNEPALPISVDVSAQEVVTEVGNILLNACLGMFGNLLQVHLGFSVPRLSLESLTALLDSLTIDQEELRYALVVHAAFRLRDGSVSGYLVIVLSVASLDRLLRSVEQWQDRQGDAR
jgi:chemotaxis protein CheC